MNEERLEKLLARYADEISSVPVPQEIKDRLPKKVSGRVRSIQVMSNLMATGIMIAGAAILIVGLLTFILRQKQELTSESVENSTVKIAVSNRGGFISHSEAQRAEESASEMLRFAQHDRAYETASGQQTYINTLSDEEFVSLLMNMNEEGLLPDVESKLFGLDLEVMDFVEMAG